MSGRIAAMEAGLLSYLKTLPNIQAWAVALGQQLDDLDEANWQLANWRWLQNAFGAQLDAIGTILGPARGILDDSDYQALLQSRAAYLQGHGDFEMLIQIVNVLANPSVPPYGIEIFPAFVYFIVEGGTPFTSLQDCKSALQQVKAAGVGIALAQTTGTPIFAFDAGAGQAGFDAGFFVSLV